MSGVYHLSDQGYDVLRAVAALGVIAAIGALLLLAILYEIEHRTRRTK